MNIFDLHKNVMKDYQDFIQGFIKIKDERILKLIEENIKKGLFWSEPIVQLSPSYEKGESISRLVDDGILRPECLEIFRYGRTETDPGKPLNLYRHQVDAINKARENRSYVLTTGTGSGKSLTYIIPIVDYVLRNGSGGGIKAIAIYPTNALVNSQYEELKKFLNLKDENNVLRKPVTFEIFTGQEDKDEKKRIRENPPDILLTNYSMLEYVLTRFDDKELVEAMSALHFIVLDELHTYRGRTGADISMLLRRTKEASGRSDVLCVGTSATLSSGGTRADQTRETAESASILLGADIKPADIINETLHRETDEFNFDDRAVIDQLKSEVEFAAEDDSFPTVGETIDAQKFCAFQKMEDPREAFRKSRFASWVESEFGIKKEESSGVLVRQEPATISGKGGKAKELKRLTGLDEEICRKGIQNLFMAGYRFRDESSNRPFFAFRLHQFIRRGETVFSTLETREKRTLKTEGLLFVPNEGDKRRLYPLVFCRECGREYFVVSRHDTGSENESYQFYPRQLSESPEDSKDVAGFLYIPEEPEEWHDEIEESIDLLPDSWKNDKGRLDKDERERIQKVYVNTLGETVDPKESDAVAMLFIKAPFKFCPGCFIEYDTGVTKDYLRLGELAIEGRSSATTVLSLSVVRHLKEMELPSDAKKILSFTDNRQDASLQSGHFNDFVRVGMIRGALCKALADHPEGINGVDIAAEVTKTLNLDYEEYGDPQRTESQMDVYRALQHFIGYHLYADFEKGHRILLPNLEQTALVKYEYQYLDKTVENEEYWKDAHPRLKSLDKAALKEILSDTLDKFRWDLAVNIDYLNRDKQSTYKDKSKYNLKDPWAFDSSDDNTYELKKGGCEVVEENLKKVNKQKKVDPNNNSYRSAYGKYIRRKVFGGIPKVNNDEINEVCKQIFEILGKDQLVSSLINGVTTYQLRCDAIIWKPGEGIVAKQNPFTVNEPKEKNENVNSFFREFYKTIALTLHNIQSREHTAQIDNEERREREKAFGKAELPVLYCSPTMELGIDISQLNVVHLRSVPPTAANYAQRSGRAGRSGQPALIMTYCSSLNQHDRYYYARQRKMVTGAVTPPQIDLGNDDLLRSHVHSIWLSEVIKTNRAFFTGKFDEIVDTETKKAGVPTCELLGDICNLLQDKSIKRQALIRAEKILKGLNIEEPEVTWHKWAEEVLDQLKNDFEKACERWISLYRNAEYQKRINQEINDNPSKYDKTQRDNAERLRNQAIQERDLLLGESRNYEMSDFYPHRYFASEGFLPGYNFPRLPVTAFIPASNQSKNKQNQYITRGRFIAISEFAPNAVIYHNGSKYVIRSIDIPINGENELTFSSARICPSCGYYHKPMQLKNEDGTIQANHFADVCESCGAKLGPQISKMVQMRKVNTRRRVLINCDEEERTRRGYDIKTSFRFAERYRRVSARITEIFVRDETGKEIKFGELKYGANAEIYRINLGNRKDKDQSVPGFSLNTKTGVWEKPPKEGESEVVADEQYHHVCPYVEDSKNSLLFVPELGFVKEAFITLQEALIRAICRVMGAEESEIASEILPDTEKPKQILFYEASEGGAGILHHIADKQSKFTEVVRAALEICHFDPETGFEIEDVNGDGEIDETDQCGKACYDCLLSYSNQRYHEEMDRHLIKPILLQLKDARLEISPVPRPRKEHYEELLKKNGSGYEAEWLTLVYEENKILPDKAQYEIKNADTTPDYYYDKGNIAIYVDGEPHDNPKKKEKDACIDRKLWAMSITPIRFNYKDKENWLEQMNEMPDIFGE